MQQPPQIGKNKPTPCLNIQVNPTPMMNDKR